MNQLFKGLTNCSTRISHILTYNLNTLKNVSFNFFLLSFNTFSFNLGASTGLNSEIEKKEVSSLTKL